MIIIDKKCDEKWFYRNIENIDNYDYHQTFINLSNFGIK